jgi:citrate lyase subunit gamma (acyl carrier protein)
MELKKAAVAGTLESSDAMITIEPNKQDGIEITLQSSVEQQFGKQIKKVVIETLEELGVKSARISVVDMGALDCTLRARVSAVIYRAAESESFDWGNIL